jgi:peptidoglycan/xylan/chitin deacetylase (PgdA/CDA1 family)
MAEHNAKGTFFVSGRRVAAHEAIIKQIVADGHEICSHGYRHLDHWKNSPLKCLSDIKRGWEAIDTALGANKAKYPFRPAYGRLNLISLLYLLIRKVPIILWSLDSGDRRKLTDFGSRDHDIQQKVLQIKKAGGAVVLAHDSEQNNIDKHSYTLECIHSELVMAKDTNMRIITVSQLLEISK